MSLKIPKKSNTTPHSGSPRKSDKRSNKRTVVVVVISSVITAVILAVGLYYYFQNRPEKVLQDAFANSFVHIAKSSPTASFTNFSYETKGDQPIRIVFQLDSKSADQTGVYDAAVRLTLNNKPHRLTATVITVSNNEMYFKIHDLRASVDALAVTSVEAASYKNSLEPLIAKIDKKWVRVVSDEITAINSQDVQKCLTALNGLNNEDKKATKELFKRSPFIYVNEVLSPEKIRGEDSFHYKLRLDLVAASSFAQNAARLEFARSLKSSCAALYTPENKQLVEQIKQAAISNPSLLPEVELWVGKKSRTISKVRINKNNSTTNINITSELNFNSKKSDVKIPTESVPFTEIGNEINRLIGN